MKYDFNKVEKKWQGVWEKKKLYEAKDASKKPKYYALVEFPYPSGDGLHVGHVRSYTAMDIVARKRRMEGYNVLYPIGWDAFGLPTENYAIKTGIHPATVTKRNTDNFRRQLKALGFSFDWSREINTTDPKYYRWTQWMFLQFFKKKLAYKANVPINWCPKDKIGLANEEVVGGKCERCGAAVLKKEKSQWMIRITAYAEELLKGLEGLDFLPEIKRQQENWIGKSEGALITFRVKGEKADKRDFHIEVFTTRPDTIFGATYVVLAPENPLITAIEPELKNSKQVLAYVKKARKKKDEERAEAKEKAGVELKGVKAVNPATKEEIPIWVGDYVFMNYGTGAIMAVPAHDERDFEFAKKHKLPMRKVILPVPLGRSRTPRIAEKIKIPSIQDEYRVVSECWPGEGELTNSGQFTGMRSEKAKKEIIKFVGGKRKILYKLRDWVFSRQRYWGEPIPIVHCARCGYVPIPEKELPLELPEIKNFKPRNDGESPLASARTWVAASCPSCNGPAKRETDVMPNWAGSSWYFLRYTDPRNEKAFADPKKLSRLMPVDWYNGGMEHVTLHLLYSRFWNQFLFDIGKVPFPEPYKKRTAHGLILGEGGVKMSKSKGNVVNPDNVVAMYGADVLRLYEMFIGPFDQAIAWDNYGIEGANRFLGKVWAVAHEKKIDRNVRNKKLEQLIHKTIKKVGDDIEAMAFNTAVSTLMIFINECQKAEAVSQEVWKNFLLILAPFAPHVAEELFHEISGVPSAQSIHEMPWPTHDPAMLQEEMFTLVVQLNGRVKDSFEVPAGAGEAEVKKMALEREKVKILLGGRSPERIIYAPGRIVNLVIKE